MKALQLLGIIIKILAKVVPDDWMEVVMSMVEQLNHAITDLDKEKERLGRMHKACVGDNDNLNQQLSFRQKEIQELNKEIRGLNAAVDEHCTSIEHLMSTRVDKAQHIELYNRCTQAEQLAHKRLLQHNNKDLECSTYKRQADVMAEALVYDIDLFQRLVAMVAKEKKVKAIRLVEDVGSHSKPKQWTNMTQAKQYVEMCMDIYSTPSLPCSE